MDFLKYVIFGAVGLFAAIVVAYLAMSSKLQSKEKKHIKQLVEGTKKSSFSMDIFYQKFYIKCVNMPFIRRYALKLRRRLEIINLEDRPWIMNNNIMKSHTIENGFYFQKLNSNFGDNVYGSCSFVAYGMLLSYYNEFVDNQIIPETLQLYNNDSTQNYFKADVYNKSYGNSYNIRNAESPGTNELFSSIFVKIWGNYFWRIQIWIKLL